MNISKWALANSKLVYYFIAILVIGGLYSYSNMSKLEDPAIKVKQAVVVTTYPGASAYEVELQVTDKLEKAIYSMSGVDKLDSNSSADLSIITVNLLTTTPDDEIEQRWDTLRRKVGDVQRELPSGASVSVVVDDYGDVYGMFYALTAEGYSNEELNDYAELVKQRIQGVDGVSRVELYGALNSTIEISIYEDRMANMGLSPVEVIQTISGQNKVVYSGYFLSGEQRLRVNVNDKYRDVEDIGNLIISGHEDDVIRLKDIARVERSYAEPTRKAMSYDRKEAIGISISAMAGTDVTRIGREVDRVLEQLRDNRLPVGIEYHKVFFQPERVRVAIEDFIVNLLESILIVVVVLMFAMGIRSGVLLGITLLVTVLGSLLFLYMLGGTLQRVSLASFILAMGMLVDNAIVIVDGILNDMKGGGLRSRNLSEIGRKTAMPLLGATIIAILAFLPLFLSPDTAGVYVRDLFVVLTVSLLLSWVLSLTMVPLQARAMFKFKQREVSSVSSDEAESLTVGQRVLRWLLEWSLRYRAVAVAVALGLVAVSGYLYKILPQSFFPDLSYNQLYIEYKLPESSNSTHTAKDLDSIAEYLLLRDDVEHVTTSVGATPSRYNLVRSIATPALSYGDIIVDFVGEDELVEAIPALQKHLTDNYPQAYVRVKRYNLMYNKYPIEATFRGPDPAVLRDLTLQAQQIMAECDDIMLITSDWERRVPVLEVDYHQPSAREVGLSRQDVALSLLVSTDGMPLESLYQGSDREQIVVRCVDRDGNRIESLESAPVFSLLPSLPKVDRELIQGVMSGAVSREDLLESVLKTTPLSQAISGVNIRWEDPVVVRHRGERAMRAQANNIPSVGAEDARRQIVERVEAIELPEGYTLSWQGEYETKTKALKYLLANIPLAIALMIGILIMLFKDYRKPLIIMLCVPLLFVGALFGVWVAGMPFGFLAICGILGLIGMMIKNGVVLMDEINEEIRRGKQPKRAIIDSALSRFRPVMMASLTTVLGMIPLLPDAMFGPLAATIMGGLLVGTVVTLLFIPMLYSIMFGVKVS
ncbi:MAG: efflux RND transporter permease subunit [Rikenellaceae bacterium]